MTRQKGARIVVFALMLAVSAHAAGRHSLIQTTSTTQTTAFKETDYNPALGPFAMLDIDQWLVKTAYGLTPEQVSVNFWTPGTYLVSWVTGDAQVGLGLTAPDPNAYNSTVLVSTSPDMNNAVQFDGEAVSYKYEYSKNPAYNLLDYTSGVIHHTLIKNLKPGTQYHYSVGDLRYAMSKVYNFTTLPSTFPLSVAVTADTGQTLNTTHTIEHLLSQDFSMILDIGDLTYADTFDSRGTYVCWLSQMFDKYHAPPFNLPGDGNITRFCQPDRPPTVIESPDTYQPKFDSWARLWEQVFAYKVTMHTNGNHELDLQPDGTLFESYNARYPQPQNPDVINTNPISYFSDKADDNLYAKAEIPGIATVFMLTTFQPNVVFGSKADKQFAWFSQELAAVNRSNTPWVVVGFHVPIYTTDPGTFKVLDCFRLAYEPLMYKYGVNIVFSGHVHAYERSHPVYNHTRDDCGPVHIVVGSGGNNEGLSNLLGWMDQIANTTSWCQIPTSRIWPNYQPQRCFSYQPQYSFSQYCPSTPPDWVAYRETGFGAGILTFVDANTAKWEWRRNVGGDQSTVSDEVTIVRGKDKCTAQ